MIPKRDWDDYIKPVLLDALEALEAMSQKEASYSWTKNEAQVRLRAKHNIRKLIAELEVGDETDDEDDDNECIGFEV